MSISQSINEQSFNNQEKHKHISRLANGTLAVTVQCMVNKINTKNTGWNIIFTTRLNLKYFYTQKCISITQNTFQLYFNYKIQTTFVKATKYKMQNTLNVFKIHVFQLLVFQLLQYCWHTWYKNEDICKYLWVQFLKFKKIKWNCHLQ